MSSPLFILTGLSAAGKSTVADALMRDQTLGLIRFVTTTTRPLRPGEVNGHHYWFVTREEFEAKLAQDDFYENAEVYGNLYGASKTEMTRLAATKKPILLVMDVQGAQSTKAKHPEAHVIFFDAPDEDLLHRLQARKSSPEEVAKRIAHVQVERTYKNIASLIVMNRDGELEKTVQTVSAYMRTNIQ